MTKMPKKQLEAIAQAALDHLTPDWRGRSAKVKARALSAMNDALSAAVAPPEASDDEV